MNYWLVKSEGSCYSIDDLKKDKRTPWTGIRNFQARNHMRDGMKKGDGVLFYHSNGTPEAPNGIYGVAKVASEAYLDKTALDPKDEHFDPKSLKAHKEGRLVLKNPGSAKKNMEGWACIDMEFGEKLKRPIFLETIKHDTELSHMLVAKTGQRLSVMPVAKHHYEKIVKMGK